MTLASLRDAGFDREVVEAVDCLTKRENERGNYESFIARVSHNPLARRVKLADLEDNLDRNRIPDPTPEDEERWMKYSRAYDLLLECDRQGRGETAFGAASLPRPR